MSAMNVFDVQLEKVWVVGSSGSSSRCVLNFSFLASLLWSSMVLCDGYL